MNRQLCHTMFKYILIKTLVIYCLVGQCIEAIEKPEVDLTNDAHLLFLRSSATYEPEIRWLAKEVESRPNADPQETLKFLADRLRQVRELSRQPDFKPSPEQVGFMMNHLHGLIDVLQEFSTLHLSDKPIHCSIHSLEHTLSAIDLLFGGLDSFAKSILTDAEPAEFGKLFIFIKELVTSHIGNCLASLKTPGHFDLDYVKGRETAHGEWRLDEMLSAWKAAPNEDELLHRARQLDLQTGHFDDARLISSLHRAANPLDVDKTLDIGVFAMDIEDSCAEIPAKVTNLVTNYQLARVLTPKEIESLDLSPRFLKINEYFRMCNQLNNPEIREETLRNIKNNFKFIG